MPIGTTFYRNWAGTVAVVVTVGMSMLLQVSSAADSIPHDVAIESTEDEYKQELTEMAFACVNADRLIGNSGGGLEERQWLVEQLVSGELLPMEQVYPRFGSFVDVRLCMGAWDDALACTVETFVRFDGAFGRTFPRWRVWEGQLALFYARGGLTSPMRAYSGFHLVPYEHGARDYRRPGRDDLQAMQTEDAAKFADRGVRRAEGRVQLETAVYRYDSPPFRALGDDHRLIRALHSSVCNGYDFVIARKDNGKFFLTADTKTLQHERIRSGATLGPEDQASRMLVFDFRIQEEKAWIPQIDRNKADACQREGVAAPAKPLASRTLHEEGGVVVGLDSPEVFSRPVRYDPPPDAVVSLKWTERESFDVPFSVPFTAAIDGDDYFFVTNDGRIYRASPAQDNAKGRTVERVFDNGDDPVIACIHESSTNRIFAFRRNSYILVDNARFFDGGSPQFASCEDVSQPKAMTYVDEEGTIRTPDKRFQLVSRCAHVLHDDGVLEPSRE